LKTNNKDKLCITTYIANFVLLIGETTIHSLFNLSIDINITINKSKTIPDRWSNIQFMIVDEISMVGYMMFPIMHLKLLPFGGLDIKLMGDFLQFPPIIDTSCFQLTSTNFYVHKFDAK
jgi:hypothetical protein